MPCDRLTPGHGCRGGPSGGVAGPDSRLVRTRHSLESPPLPLALQNIPRRAYGGTTAAGGRPITSQPSAARARGGKMAPLRAVCARSRAESGPRPGRIAAWTPQGKPPPSGVRLPATRRRSTARGASPRNPRGRSRSPSAPAWPIVGTARRFPAAPGNRTSHAAPARKISAPEPASGRRERAWRRGGLPPWIACRQSGGTS